MYTTVLIYKIKNIPISLVKTYNPPLLFKGSELFGFPEMPE